VTARRPPTGIASLLDECLDRASGQRGAAAIWRVWDDAVGPQIARRAQPVRLRGRTLVVAVSSAPWMQELQLLKPTVLAELNRRLPRPLVGDLYFVLTALDESAAGPAPRTRPAARCAPPPAAADLGTLPEPLRRSFAGVLAAWRRRAGS
jgi:predicted nucleic acid-binding Zn ribbon protein